MSAQVGERLFYEGQELSMCNEPLDAYFASGGSKPKFAFTWSALWRGYVGTWEIQNGRLYLIELRGMLIDETEANVASVFPENPDKVFAEWYSGTLRIPEGEMVKYVHNGFKSLYERDRLIHIEKGVVTGINIRHNVIQG